MKGGVSAAALESYGPGLVAHSVAMWFTQNKIPADFVACMPSDPNDLPDGGKCPGLHCPIAQSVVFLLNY